MTDEQMDEARAWVALAGWRWMPGMVDRSGMRVIDVGPDGLLWLVGGEWDVSTARPGDLTEPDVTDPATIGCLWALAREITGSPLVHAYAMVGLLGRPKGWRCDIKYALSATPSAALLRACQEHEGVSRG